MLCVCSDVSKERTTLIFKQAAVYSGKKCSHRRIPFEKAPCVTERGTCAHTHTQRERRRCNKEEGMRVIFTKRISDLCRYYNYGQIKTVEMGRACMRPELYRRTELSLETDQEGVVLGAKMISRFAWKECVFLTSSATLFFSERIMYLEGRTDVNKRCQSGIPLFRDTRGFPVKCGTKKCYERAFSSRK
jgi:hypothetical protein